MPHSLAVDAGGTSTRAIVLDSTGLCRGFGRAGGGNPISSGADAAADALAEAARKALASASVPPAEVGNVLVAMAGARTDLPPDHGNNTGVTAGLVADGLRGPFAFASDLLATYFSGTSEPDGYALVAGTGAAAVRVRGGQVEKAADGTGWLLGDAGSGFWIGREVARAVVAALDGRGPATALTALLLDAAGVADTGRSDTGQSDTGQNDTGQNDESRPASLRRLVDALYRMRPVHLAQFAPLAFAAPGDATAARILERAGDALAGTLGAVVVRDLAGPVVLGGSVLVRQRAISGAIEGSLRQRGTPMPTRLVPDGTVGAAVLALRRGGVPVDAAVFGRIAASLDRLR